MRTMVVEVYMFVLLADGRRHALSLHGAEGDSGQATGYCIPYPVASAPTPYAEYEIANTIRKICIFYIA